MIEDSFYKAEEDELFGAPDNDAAQEEEEQQQEFIDDRSPEEFSYEDDDEFNEGIREQKKDQPSGDYLTKFLRSRNIDRNKIQFENEDGSIEEVRFDDLDDEEKFAILSEEQELPITDQEIEDINYLREHEINLADLIAQQREQAVREYLEQNSTPQYEVDSLDDNQLFAYDLISRYGEELTDEEIDAEIARARENEELFAKKIAHLRKQYKEQEDAHKEALSTQQQQQFAAEKQELIRALSSAAANTHELQGVELEDADRSEVLDFLTKEDAQGRTEFSKLLSDPEAIFKMAWYMKFGEDTFNTTVDYFKKKLEAARRSEPKQNRTIIKPRPKQNADPYGLDGVFK